MEQKDNMVLKTSLKSPRKSIIQTIFGQSDDTIYDENNDNINLSNKKVGINKNNPLDRHKSLKTKSIVQIPFSKLEVSNVLDSDNFKRDFEGIRDNLILEILYCTGVRRQELINLKIRIFFW